VTIPAGPYVEPAWRDWRGLLAPWPEGDAAIAALETVEVFDRLAAFDPLMIGTYPLGLVVPGSDLDIACHMPDPGLARATLRQAFGGHGPIDDTLSRRDRVPSLVLGFAARGHAIEIFGQPVPAAAQMGHRHLRAEHFLLWWHGVALGAAVLALKRGGMKTEPAFATALGLPPDGDAYRQVLDHATALAARGGLSLHF
jgi:hypothetical protein